MSDLNNRFKRQFSVFISVVILIVTFINFNYSTGNIYASKGTTDVDGVSYTYNVNEDGDTATVIKIQTKETEVEIPAEIDGYKITSLGSISLLYSSSLEKLKLPKTLETYADGALNQLISLKSIDVAENNPTYAAVDGILYTKDKTKLLSVPPGYPATEFTTPENVTEIGMQACLLNQNIVYFETSDNLVTIGNSAFSSSVSLEEIYISKSVVNIGTNVFGKCYKLYFIDTNRKNPEFSSLLGVLYNKDYTSLIQFPVGNETDEYEIVNGCTEISVNAFNGAVNLKKVNIPESVTLIDTSAFDGSGITEIDVPDSVTEIGITAFANCSELVRVHIPDAITELSDSLFMGCTSLEEVNLPSKITEIPIATFYMCASLAEIEIPDTVTLIGQGAFQGCTSLKSIVIPKQCTKIDSLAFTDCINLSEITIYEKVKTIADKAIGYSRDIFMEDIPIDNGLVINCYTDTAAEKYCIENTITSKSMGSPPAVYNLTWADVTTLKNHLVGIKSITQKTYNWNKYDVNVDGVINIADLNMMKYVLMFYISD
ncbi:MAG: leucine-rich repeat protein [Ruminococcus sp.]|jgi:hypothetical protein|nr:leucine-rich repeat protein [Ruminococcus sp.]